MVLDKTTYIQKWTTRFQPNDTFRISEEDLSEFAQDTADSFGGDGGTQLNELVLPQDVVQGRWYADSAGIWEARRSFSASASPVSGPNWRSVVSFTGQSAPIINVASLTDATDAGRKMLKASDAAAQRALLSNPGIAANQWGKSHPGWNNTDKDGGLYQWLVQAILALQSAQPVKAPAAPTNGRVNDVTKEWAFTVNPLYTSFAQYKINGLPGTTEPVYLSAANSYQVDTTIYVKVGSAVATGNLAVYVAGSGIVPDGQPLTNDKPFTGSAVVTPPTPTGDTTNPYVTINVPATGATLAPGSQVLLTATATDNVAVQGVAFTDGATGAFIGAGAKNGTKYTFLYTVGAAGPLSLTATATDAAGNSESATVNVTVQAAATTQTKATPPYFGTIDDINNVVTLGSAYSFTEIRWGVEGQGPQALASNSICSPGNIAGRLFAYVVADAATNRLQSDTVYSTAFSLNATANNAPTVALTSPQAGQNLGVGDPFVLNASPQDADGTQDIKKVEFLDNGVKFAETTVAPHIIQGNLAAGAHSFTARVYDMVGAMGLSNSVAISANANTSAVGIILLGGQSNELSNADKAAAQYSPLSVWGGDFNQVFANVRIVNGGAGLENLQDGVNTRPAEDFSFPVPFSYHMSNTGVWLNGTPGQGYNFQVITRAYFIAKRWKELYPNRELVLVQAAVGGVTRASWLKSSNHLYQRSTSLLAVARQAIAAEGKTSQLLAIDFTQGEADQALDQATYNSQLRQMWSDFAADVAEPSTQFIEWGIPPTGDTGTYVTNPHNGTKTTWASESANRHYYAADFVALEEDRIHWNAASQARAAAQVVATATSTALSFPSDLTQAAPSVTFDNGVATIAPPSAAWLMREFYYQIGNEAPIQLINSWSVLLPRALEIGEFKCWIRAVPGRSRSANATNTAVVPARGGFIPPFGLSPNIPWSSIVAGDYGMTDYVTKKVGLTVPNNFGQPSIVAKAFGDRSAFSFVRAENDALQLDTRNASDHNFMVVAVVNVRSYDSGGTKGMLVSGLTSTANGGADVFYTLNSGGVMHIQSKVIENISVAPSVPTAVIYFTTTDGRGAVCINGEIYYSQNGASFADTIGLPYVQIGRYYNDLGWETDFLLGLLAWAPGLYTVSQVVDVWQSLKSAFSL